MLTFAFISKLLLQPVIVVDKILPNTNASHETDRTLMREGNGGRCNAMKSFIVGEANRKQDPIDSQELGKRTSSCQEPPPV
ncbi:hypothetical protein PHSY_004393 [Pseudozyma hubeiensis SY62]|uniref:Uncharacterized protein n=1 Tax=Pseudozyma hubeiensis (strain SY62) TaxID=1305764 RepID=R9P650_PSEHS|nr:hypothetical protein PHSY_004393 [Pseudozyma hubeiensis SY62]GAC96809.1 hypothetical protein PHSY_004393 [Pseudozyma hubeiensis SY62]